MNTGSGITIGGVDGAPDSAVAVSPTSNPFSLRSQTFTAGQEPEYVDARVVEGQLGRPGAVMELTAQVDAERMADPTAAPVPMQVSVRLRDVAGVGQWGYGPSGFFPQWIEPDQREAITSTYGGSVADYLMASNDPMTDQGSYYYSSPVVEVESFTITVGGEVVASGSDGEVLVDYVTQSFDAAASAVVDNGVQWTEFSTLLDDGRSLKVGETVQSSVGTLPYAMMLSTDGERLANGSLAASQRWTIGDITITPDQSSVWTSPRSGKSYFTTYTAELAGTDAKSTASFTYTAVIDDQEVDVAGRTVYEGLYAVSGTLDGQPINGYAWAEVQPVGHARLTPTGHLFPPGRRVLRSRSSSPDSGSQVGAVLHSSDATPGDGDGGGGAGGRRGERLRVVGLRERVGRHHRGGGRDDGSARLADHVCAGAHHHGPAGHGVHLRRAGVGATGGAPTTTR